MQTSRGTLSRLSWLLNIWVQSIKIKFGPKFWCLQALKLNAEEHVLIWWVVVELFAWNSQIYWMHCSNDSVTIRVLLNASKFYTPAAEPHCPILITRIHEIATITNFQCLCPIRICDGYKSQFISSSENFLSWYKQLLWCLESHLRTFILLPLSIRNCRSFVNASVIQK